MTTRLRTAFTLVELLVVIAIIGVLVALLLPAVQAAREAARRSQCSNQLRQQALGWHLHHDVQQFLPSAGWGWRWMADPDRGFGKTQSGSWCYSILPYIEAGAIHQIGAGATNLADKKKALATLSATPVSTFYCPSRRSAVATVNVNSGFANNFYNADNALVLARADYAANMGPEPQEAFPNAPSPRLTQWFTGPTPPQGDAGQGFVADRFPNYDLLEAIQGVSFQHTEFNLKQITDGTSNTYMVGEKSVNPDFYDASTINSVNFGDDQGAWAGDDLDTNRCTDLPPVQDQEGLNSVFSFGGPHPGTFQMAMCDVSVRAISYEVDPLIHRALGTRAKGDAVSGF